MRFITADKIYTISSEPLEDYVIVIDSKGTIADILPGKELDELKVERYEGFICPGFVNTHCHLELSFMKDKIQPKQGLHTFIKEVENLKKPKDEEVLQAIQDADVEMYTGGVVAVGDISNTANTIAYKAGSNIYYHNFIETYAFDENKAETAFDRGLNLQKELQIYLGDKIYDLSSITPHAPYSASVKLLGLFKEHAIEHNSILTIHNQETDDENLFFREKKGSILDRLHYFNINTDDWQAPGVSSLRATLPYLPSGNKLQLVHNTFASKEDILFAQNYSKNLFWCFCVNANIYIEDKVPNVHLFTANNCTITLGTDSYASNWSLSIFDEIKTLHKHFPEITWDDLLQWGTFNGARFLGKENTLGSIEKGKTPGLNAIDRDFNRVKKLV